MQFFFLIYCVIAILGSFLAFLYTWNETETPLRPHLASILPDVLWSNHIPQVLHTWSTPGLCICSSFLGCFLFLLHPSRECQSSPRLISALLLALHSPFLPQVLFQGYGFKCCFYNPQICVSSLILLSECLPCLSSGPSHHASSMYSR